MLAVAATLTLLEGCSGGPAIAPKPAPPLALGPIGRLNVNRQPIHQFASRYSCPATGPLEYLSDNGNFVVDVYAGKFNGQAPCGVITSGLNGAFGLYVDPATRDLYVASVYGAKILVFHRGQTTAYNTYADPAGDLPEDVTLAKDGTVISSNGGSINTFAGSISTWIKGPNGGTFVGTFPMYNYFAAHITIGGDFIAVDQNGTVYYDSFDTTNSIGTAGTLSSLSCPAGKCGTQTPVAGVLCSPTLAALPSTPRAT
jgi:hypothetical protein